MNKTAHKMIAAGTLLLSSVSVNVSALDILVPAYANPCCAGGPEMWQELIATANSDNNVTLHVVFNPASGPGTMVDPNYLLFDGSGPLVDINVNGTLVYGYVATGYASRSLAIVKDEIDRYFDTLYSGYIGHIFLDEMSNDLQHSGYYREISDYVKNKSSLARVIGNPGLATTENISGQTLYSVNDYINSVDTLVTFENDEWDYQNNYTEPSWIGEVEAKQLAHIVYAAQWSTQLTDLLASRGASLYYITDDDLYNPYDQLPSYWSELVDSATVNEFTQTIYPISLKQRKGSSSDQEISVLSQEDQANYDDDWSAYREFYPQFNGYRGEFTFELPEGVEPTDVVSMNVDTNYRGQTTAHQVWNWRLRNFNQRTWTTVGNNTEANDWQWSHLTFPVEANAQEYIRNNKIKLRFETSSGIDNAQLDFLSITLSLKKPDPEQP